MQQFEKFMFGTRFDNDSSGQSVSHQDPIRLAAFEQGRIAGRAESEQSVEQATANALANISAAMEKLYAEREDTRTEMNKSAVEVALALVQKFLPEMIRRNGLAEIESLVGNTLSNLVNEPRLVVRLSDHMVETLRGYVDELAARCGFQGDVVLLADPELGPEDCHIEWADGGVERNSERLWQDVEQAAARLLPNLPNLTADRAMETTKQEPTSTPATDTTPPAADNN